MKPGFYTLPLVVSNGDGRNFVLLVPFLFVRPNGEIIFVPAGTTSDGASTPRGIWSIIPPFGVYWPAAFLHDYLYRETKRPRAECDDILLEAMEILNTPLAERDVIFRAVRMAGESSFEADRSAAAGVPT